jgi:teichuronic acid biosynthesis glycosyltransferase TuaC
MKVLLVTNLFPSEVDPERGVFTLQLAKQLAKHCELTVVFPITRFPKWKIFSRFKKWYVFAKVPYRYEIDGVTVYSPKYPMLPKVSEAMQAKLMTVGLKRCISRLHKDHSFDVVNSHWFYPDSVAVDSISHLLNIPHIATGLGCDVNHDIFEKDKRQAILDMTRRAKALTVVSSDLKKVLVEQRVPSEKIHTLPNGVDVAQFKRQDKQRCRKLLGLKKSQNIILYVGRLSDEKNIARLIEAFSKLKNAKKIQDLYIVGDGVLRGTLEKLTTKLGLEKRVNFVGKVEHALVATWMGAADLFCLPSIREGCPNVVLEALGSGRPVIASNVGGIPDMVSDRTGILFQPLDISDIAQSLEQALERDWDSEEVANSVKELTWENAALNYLSVYKKAIS